MRRYGFSNQGFADYSLTDALMGGRSCIEALILEGDRTGKWGDSSTMPRWRSQLSANDLHGQGDTVAIDFSTFIPRDWQILQPGAFLANGTQTEQCSVACYHSTGNDPQPVELRLIGDSFVLFVLNRYVWQAPMVQGQWDDWKLETKFDAAAGSVMLRRNGASVFGVSDVPVLSRTDEQAYFKIGPYLWGRMPIKSRRMGFIV